MKKLISNLLIPGAAAAMFAASASAQVMVQGVGSSAQFQAASLAAFQIAGLGAGHYTAKSAGQISDLREAGIPVETGNLAVVWNAAMTQVWTYLSVDSVVGNRAYFAQPRTTLQLVAPLPAAGQLISTALWGADAATIPAAVVTLINGIQFNAAYTDILPADAKFAQNRINCGVPPGTLGCLGYSTANPNVGVAISSHFSASVAHPINFNIFGSDPITGAAIPPYTVVPVGIAPIIFIVNRTNAAGFGQTALFSDLTFTATAQELFTGINCSGSAFGTYDAAHFFAVNPILREPLSGTMNTFEFNFMVVNLDGSIPGGFFSQEGVLLAPGGIPGNFTAINLANANTNPLNLPCGPVGANSYASNPQGTRLRAIGTGEVVSSVKSTTDSIGYIFFGYGNVSSIAGSTNSPCTPGMPCYGYLSFNTADPINPSGSYGTPYSQGTLNYPGGGLLPTCTAPCPIPANTSFPNIRNGSFRGWSLLRAVADAGSTALTNLQALATIEQNQINGTQPDFLPFNPTTNGDNGFVGYRIHFNPNSAGGGVTGVPAFQFNSGNVPNNGITNPALEAGGDVGGCLELKTVPNDPPCRF